MNGPDLSEAERFLTLLGKNGNSRLRAFWPKNTPLPPDTPRGFKASFSDAPQVLPRWQQQGLGIYAVIGNGGDGDTEINSCPALFCEWDDRPKDEQLSAWQTYGLPEPTLSVDTGGKSIHLYWVFTEPISPDHWRDLTARLISLTGADTTNRNPSRVMRLPGAFYYHYDPDAGQIIPTGQARIVQESGQRYDAALFDELLPQLPEPDPIHLQSAPPLSGSGDLPPRPIEQLYDAFQRIPEFRHGEGRYSELLGLARRLYVDMGRENAIQLIQAHSPSLTDVPAYFRTAPRDVSPGSIWPYLRDHYGIDISRRDLWGETGPSAPPQGAPGDPEAQGPATDNRPPRSELLAAALAAAEAGDQDQQAEIMAELMARFRMTASQIQAQLFRLLTRNRSQGKTEQRPGFVDVAKVQGLDHLLPGFIAAEEQTLLHAPKGTGKTLAALAIARAICCGTGLLDQSSPAAPGRVLYLATDSGCASMGTQMAELGLTDLPEFKHGHPDQRFFLRGHDSSQGVSAWEATIEEVLWLIETIERHQFDLVIIDSAKACLSLTETDYTDNRAVGALLTLFQRVIAPRCAVLWLHHDGTQNGHNAGAKAWGEIPVMVHRLERVEAPSQPRRGHAPGPDDEGPYTPPPGARKWVCLKSRIGGDEREFHYLLTPEGDLMVAPDVEIISNCRDAVISVMWSAAEPDRVMSHAEIVAGVLRTSGHSAKSVKNTLGQLCRGRSPSLMRLGRGRYRIAPGLAEKLAVIQNEDAPLIRPFSTRTKTDENPDRDWNLPWSQQSPNGTFRDFPGTSGESPNENGWDHVGTKANDCQGLDSSDLKSQPGMDFYRPNSEQPSHNPSHEPVGSLLRSGERDREAPPSEPRPAWFPRLLELRQQQPQAVAATLALLLDPDGTGRPRGADVAYWLPLADQLLRELNP